MGSVLLALAAAAAVYFYLGSLGRRCPVVVAAAAVPAGKVLGPGELRVVMMPAEAVHPQAVRSLQEGLGLVSSAELLPGEQVLRPRVFPPEQAGPGGRLAPGVRAMLVPVPPERWPGGTVRPGGLVDVVFVSGDPDQPRLARVLLPSLRVLDVRDDRGMPWGEGRGVPLGVVVAVTPGEAEKLAFALEHGSVYLAQCPPDPEVVPTDGVGWDSLFLNALGLPAVEAGPEEAGR